MFTVNASYLAALLLKVIAVKIIEVTMMNHLVGTVDEVNDLAKLSSEMMALVNRFKIIN
ncbi:hypothetical protein LPY66_08195 [Dehalobacter sp. DCM]|uniref:hypothetical protein n=1 Tax=Dehalobacter sp. DCM TaxID=2907827 RepID=UPI00308185A2|nr:hypothetical protein LPY66_08195 [Dehalobacter sp. DCM]